MLGSNANSRTIVNQELKLGDAGIAFTASECSEIWHVALRVLF